MAHYDELTLAEMLVDPMILSLARADGWSKAAFKHEMVWASQVLHRAKSAKGIQFAPTATAIKAHLEGCCAY